MLKEKSGRIVILVTNLTVKLNLTIDKNNEALLKPVRKRELLKPVKELSLARRKRSFKVNNLVNTTRGLK